VGLVRHVGKCSGGGSEFGSEGFGGEVSVEVDGFESLKERGRSSKLGVFIFMGVGLCLRLMKVGVWGVLGGVEVEGFESLQEGRGSVEVGVWKVICLMMLGMWVLVLVVVFVGVGKVGDDEDGSND